MSNEVRIYKHPRVGKGLSRGLRRVGKWTWRKLREMEDARQANEAKLRIRQKARLYRDNTGGDPW